MNWIVRMNAVLLQYVLAAVLLTHFGLSGDNLCLISQSSIHRITKWLRLKELLEAVWYTLSAQAGWVTLPKIMFRQLLSPRMETPPGLPVPVLSHPHGKRNLLCFSFWQLPLVLLLGTTEENGFVFFVLTFQVFIYSGVYILIMLRFPPEPSLLKAEQPQSLSFVS